MIGHIPVAQLQPAVQNGDLAWGNEKAQRLMVEVGNLQWLLDELS